MMGYLNRPEDTQEAIDPEGWIHTGDLATKDKDGYINITGKQGSDDTF
jgi:long-subunit acyl-CoA synthetase (AMP-forming)